MWGEALKSLRCQGKIPVESELDLDNYSLSKSVNNLV